MGSIMARKSSGPWWWEARQQWTSRSTESKSRWVVTRPKPESGGMSWKRQHRSTVADGNLFITLADTFLDWINRNKKAKTYKVYRTHLEAFGKAYPALTVAEVKPYHLDAVISAHSGWSKSTIRGFGSCANLPKLGGEEGIHYSQPAAQAAGDARDRKPWGGR